MMYEELFHRLEKSRWAMHSLPWSSFDAALLTDEQAQTIKMNAITEWASLPATEMFLRDNRDDADFCSFMSVWFYEEMKHALVLVEYLRRVRPEFAPTEEELKAIRFDFAPAPAEQTLMLHFCGEIRLTQWYRRARLWHQEPLIKKIYEHLSADEARHAGAYYRYMERAIEKHGDKARAAFAKIGTLMTAVNSDKAMHPTNLHVNPEFYPNDTVQSRLPEPEWLEKWLSAQIRFTEEDEAKVKTTILAKLSSLLKMKIETPKQLRKYWIALERKHSETANVGTISSTPTPAPTPMPLPSVQPALSLVRPLSTKGSTMKPYAEYTNVNALNTTFDQLKLEFDSEFGVLWARMKPEGRPCFTRSFNTEVRRCQHLIEATGGQVSKDNAIHSLRYVVLASAVKDIFNLGGDLDLFANLVETKDREGLAAYARTCIDISYHNYRGYNLPLHTISLVQGHALGGGFESALSSAVLVAERSAQFGLPEITFNLFPGMGAYTYLARKVGLRITEELITSGHLYSAEKLHEMGVVDILADDGKGEQAVMDYVRSSKGSRNGLLGVLQARQRHQQVSYEELLDTTMIWVDTALNITEKDLRMMKRLVRAQERRVQSIDGSTVKTSPIGHQAAA